MTIGIGDSLKDNDPRTKGRTLYVQDRIGTMTTRANAIAFLRALRAGGEGAVIYQDVIDHVLSALDAAHEERIKRSCGHQR